MSLPSLRSALAATVLAAAALPALAGFSFIPGRVQTGKAFDLMLVGSDFNCATEFSRLSSSVGEEDTTKIRSIYLNYHAEDNPAVRCGPRTQPMGPVYRIANLPPGEYPVYRRSLDGCVIAPDPCLIYVIPQRVGTLTVTAGPAYDSGWFLEPRRMQEGPDAVLTLLNRDRGDCQTGYANNTWARISDQSGGKTEYVLRFETLHIKRVCDYSVQPFGPSFRLGTVTPGRYPVKAYDLPSCAFDKNPCIPIKPWDPVLEDTLVVTGPAGLSPADGPKPRGRGAVLSRGILHVTPGYDGPWRPGRLDMNGRTLPNPNTGTDP